MARDLTGVLDAVLAGILVLDAAGRVELANAAAARILDAPVEALRGRPVAALLGADHALARLTRTALAGAGSAAEDECVVARPDGTDLSIDVAASPLFDDAGGLDGAVLALRDSTIRRRLQSVVSERQHLEAFGRIAAGVAHEVKNPLGGIRGAAEILAARAGDAKTLDAAELIVREVDRIAGLVDDLMVFSHEEATHFAPTNIHRILDDVIALVSMEPLARGVDVERHYDPSIPELRAEADRLAQVFLNLARNALQAMEGAPGTLRMTTRMLLDRRLATEGRDQHASLVVEVADTGPGIPEEVLEKLATPFFTTRPAGTGLGLALSRHFVARHGGTLRIESRLGEGTRVQVTLPLRSSA